MLELGAYATSIAFGDPEASVEAVLTSVDMDTPPLRLFLGTEGLPVVRAAWESVSNAAQGEPKVREIASP